MPELQALYKEIQDQEVNVVGIVADGMNNESALKIVQLQGVEFTNIVPDQKFTHDFVSGISVVPVTMLVNSTGKIVGNKIVGARSKEEFKKIIKQQLK